MKEKKGKMSDMEHKAKLHVLNGLKDMASKAMGGQLKGLKKVTVASNSPEGLEFGLKRAMEETEKAPDTEAAMPAHGEASDSLDAPELEGPKMDGHLDPMGDEGEHHSGVNSVAQNQAHDGIENPEQVHDMVHGMNENQADELMQKLHEHKARLAKSKQDNSNMMDEEDRIEA